MEEKELEMYTASKRWMSLYGVNVNLQRSIPMIYDGLKPIHRRILYTIYKNYPRHSKVTVAIAAGKVLEISPHGELGLKDVFAGLAQPFSNNIPLLKASGNCGTATAGDDSAAGRYWGVYLSDFAYDVLFSEFDGKVGMNPNYDDSTIEPTILPAKFPIILLNGSAGIGYTLSSDIYPYNLNEIADATIKLLKNPKADVKLIPDSPTGCDIIPKDDETFWMQSSFELDNVNYIITFTNTPYKRFLRDINKKLNELHDSTNPFPEILSADDESDLIHNKIKYVIRCKPCNLYRVLDKLFTSIPGLRIPISTKNMIVTDSLYRTRKYNIRQILLAWIKERFQFKRSWLLRRTVILQTEYNMLTGKAYMLSEKNLNKTITTIKNCEHRSDIVDALMKAFPKHVSSSQANYMIDVKMYQLTHEEYLKTVKKMDDIQAEVDRIEDIVSDPVKINQCIIDELKEIKEKYGYPRRSKILGLNNSTVNIGVVQIFQDGSVIFSETATPEHLSSDITPVSGTDVCLIDDKGRFLWVDTTKVPHDKRIMLTSIGRTQMSKCIAAVSNTQNDIVILSNKGRIKYMPIDKIPSNQTRKPLVPLDEDEYLVSILEVHDTSQDLLMYTTDGLGKRFQLTNLNKVLSVDAQGQFLVDNKTAAGMFIINPKKPLLVYVTKLGRIRVNHSKFLIAGNKFGKLKPIISMTPQDDLIAVFCVDETQSIQLNHVDGRITTVNVSSITPTTMSIPPERPKHVPACKVIKATIS
jgi:DNA gyrase/topoisomerase IV subunit A